MPAKQISFHQSPAKCQIEPLFTAMGEKHAKKATGTENRGQMCDPA